MLLAQKKKREYNCTVRAMTRKKEARGDFSFFLSYFRIVLAYVAKSPKKEKYLRFVTFIVMISTVNLSLSSVHCTLYALIRREVIFWSFFLAETHLREKDEREKRDELISLPLFFAELIPKTSLKSESWISVGLFGKWKQMVIISLSPSSSFPFMLIHDKGGENAWFLDRKWRKKRS